MKQKGEGRTQGPQPQQPAPWPTPQQAQWPQQWPPQQPQPQSEGTSMEGQSEEGRRTEGFSSSVTGTLAEERARFRGQSELFRRSRQASALHRTEQETPVQDEAENPLLAKLASQEGLAQAVLAAEILGKPRALRPFTTRK